MLQDVTYLSRKMNVSPHEVWELPHSHYMAYLKHNITFDLQETEEGQKILDNFNRYINPRSEADLVAIRQFGNYQTKKRGD